MPGIIAGRIMRLLLLLLPISLACKPSETTVTITSTTTTTTIARGSTTGHQTRPAEDISTTAAQEDTTTAAGEETTSAAEEETTTAEGEETTPGAEEETTTAPIDCPEGWIDATQDGLGCLDFVEAPDGINWLATQTICQTNNGYSVEALDMLEVNGDVTKVWSFLRLCIHPFQAGKLFDLALLTSYFSHRETWWLGLTDLVR